MQNPWPTNKVAFFFARGKSLILFKLSTQQFPSTSFKAGKEMMSSKSVHMGTAKRTLWLFFLLVLCSPEAQHLLQMDQQTMIDLSPWPYFHLFVHLPILVFFFFHPVFSSELKETKRKERKAGGCLEQGVQPYPCDTYTHSDPWNTIQPAPCTLGPGSK